MVVNSDSCSDIARQLVSEVVDIRVQSVYEMNGVTDIAQGVRSHNALYAIFTSGSTGRPKGIVTDHPDAATRKSTISRNMTQAS